jgi:hypothetical protein
MRTVSVLITLVKVDARAGTQRLMATVVAGAVQRNKEGVCRLRTCPVTTLLHCTSNTLCVQITHWLLCNAQNVVVCCGRTEPLEINLVAD